MKKIAFFIAVVCIISCTKQQVRQPIKVVTILDSIKYGVYQVHVRYVVPRTESTRIHIIDKEGCFDTCFVVMRSGTYTSRQFECCGPPRIVTDATVGQYCP